MQEKLKVEKQFRVLYRAGGRWTPGGIWNNKQIAMAAAQKVQETVPEAETRIMSCTVRIIIEPWVDV